jgi:hypothetical protein
MPQEIYWDSAGEIPNAIYFNDLHASDGSIV